MIDRRTFVKSLAILGGSSTLVSLIDPNLIVLKSIDGIDLSSSGSDCLNQKYYFDDYINNEILIQAYEFEIGSGAQFTFQNTGNKKVVILCYNLIINDKFDNPSGDLVVFANSINARSGALINISGHNAKQNGLKELSHCDGNNPDGLSADNVAPDGIRYEIDGKNGGSCSLYFSKFEGFLKVESRGGNGGKGEDGGDACNGRNGTNGKDDHCNSLLCREEGGSQGEDGMRPGNNGNGGSGGSAGNGGKLTLNFGLLTKQINESYEKSLLLLDGKIECSVEAGLPGSGGNGANATTIGGSGGKGGIKMNCWERDRGPCGRRENGRYPDGKNRNSEHGAIGTAGLVGFDGVHGIIETSPTPLGIVEKIPSSFIRLLLLKAEYFYINNDIQKTIDILQWILSFRDSLGATALIQCSQLSTYLKDEQASDFNHYFVKAEVYLNQLNLGFDYFGNPSNYVTVLDTEFINDKIETLRKAVLELEEISNEVCERNLQADKVKTIFSKQRENNIVRVGELKREIEVETLKLFELNREILSRQNEISFLKENILKKETDFKSAVESASNGCTLGNVLDTFSSFVTIGTGIAAGIGAIGGALEIISGTNKLKNDFISTVDKVGPWFDPEKWKEVFNYDNKSLINQVNIIKSETNEFNNNVNIIKETFINNKNKGTNLMALTHDFNSKSILSKEKFIEQMKQYIGKFPEAQIYQNEVIKYIDFCDVTNQKRQEFTFCFLSILQIQNQIIQFENDNSRLSMDLARSEINNVDSLTRISFMDSYFSAKQILLRYIYLQSKAIDYFTLTTRVFKSSLYDFGIKALNKEYINLNQARLQKYLEKDNYSRSKITSLRPVSIKFIDLPLSFLRFREGIEYQGGKLHTLNFKIEPRNKYFLDGNWSEIYITSVEVFLRGVKTSTGLVSFNLKQLGDSMFITSSKERVFFSHKPVVKSLSYSLQKNSYEGKNSFSNITGDYKIKGEYAYVGISPFAHWNIEIDPSVPYNEGLSLEEVEGVDFYFEFLHKPFDN